MRRFKSFLRKNHETTIKNNEREAKLATLEVLFNDLYNDRRRIYKLNFFRGIVFGAGSALGGTVVIALAVWLLSLFVNAPLIGDIFKNAQQSIEQTTEQSRQKIDQ